MNVLEEYPISSSSSGSDGLVGETVTFLRSHCDRSALAVRRSNEVIDPITCIVSWNRTEADRRSGFNFCRDHVVEIVSCLEEQILSEGEVDESAERLEETIRSKALDDERVSDSRCDRR